MLTTQPILKYEDLEKLIAQFGIPGSTELLLRSGIQQRFVESITVTCNPRRIILRPLRSHRLEVCNLDFLVSCCPKSEDIFCLESNNSKLRINITRADFDFQLPAIIFELRYFSIPFVRKILGASQ